MGLASVSIFMTKKGVMPTTRLAFSGAAVGVIEVTLHAFRRTTKNSKMLVLKQTRIKNPTISCCRCFGYLATQAFLRGPEFTCGLEHARMRGTHRIKAKSFLFLRTIKRAKSSDSLLCVAISKTIGRIIVSRAGHSWADRQIKDAISCVIRSDKGSHCANYPPLSASRSSLER